MARKVEIPDDNDDNDEEFPDVAQLLREMKSARLIELTESNIKSLSPECTRQLPESPKHVPDHTSDKHPSYLTNDQISVKILSSAQPGTKSQIYQDKRYYPESAGALRLERPNAKENGEREVTTGQDHRGKQREILQKERIDSESDSGSTDVSDFIASDISSIGESHDEATLARRIRRLARGTRMKTCYDNNEQNLNLEMKKLTLLSSSDESQCLGEVVDSFSTTVRSSGVQIRPPHFSSRETSSNSEITDRSEKSKVEETKNLEIVEPQRPQYPEPEDTFKRFDSDATDLLLNTPPSSPTLKPKKLTSPKKLSQRIPITPHRPSMDAFWQQDIVNEWNDEYSPAKKRVTFPKALPRDDANLPPIKSLKSPQKIPVKQKVTVKASKKNFSEKKQTLAESFLQELDEKITQGEISRLAASTGGVKIVWSKKLNSTAGRANWKRETVRHKDLLPESSTSSITYKHHAAIELAEKVIDDEDRLLNVLAHEFCHLANFMVSNIRTNPHGKEFKVWAAKCSKHFSHRGVQVTTKHSYAIDYKYIWQCEGCSLEVKRHSKSVDPQKHRCGSCMGCLIQTKPVPRNSAKVCEYQLFVRENMKRIRQENPASPQKELMGLMGKKYQEFKASRLKDDIKQTKQDDGDWDGKLSEEQKDDSSDEKVTDEDEVESVVRKLSFFDLTSS